jgi:hypothetical protein
MAYSADALAAYQQGRPAQQENSLEGKFYSLPKDTTEVMLRILPSWTHNGVKAPLPFKIASKHWNLPLGDQGNNVGIACFKSYNNPDGSQMDCPICNVIEEFKNTVDMCADNANFRVAVKAQMSAVFNVLVLRDTSNPANAYNPEEPLILKAKTSLSDWVVEKLMNPAQYGDLTDPYQGFNISVKREKAGGKFIYTMLPMQSPIAGMQNPDGTIAPDQNKINAIVAQIHDLDAIWKAPDDAFIQKTMTNAAKFRQICQNYSQNMGNIAGAMQGGFAQTPQMSAQNMGFQNTQQVNTPPQNTGAFNPFPNAQNPAATMPAQTMQPQNTAPAQGFANPQQPMQQAAFMPKPQEAPVAAPVAQPTPEVTAPAGFPNASAAVNNTASAVAPDANTASAVNQTPPFTPDTPAAAPIQDASGRPACFGNAGVYNEYSEKCLPCHSSFDCKTALGK